MFGELGTYVFHDVNTENRGTSSNEPITFTDISRHNINGFHLVFVGSHGAGLYRNL